MTVNSGNVRVATILTTRCMKTGKDFGIRFEKTGSKSWTATWAFKIPPNQKSEKGEPQESGKLSGKFNLDEKFPGCPYCNGKLYIICNRCGEVYCHDSERGIYSKCPWCGTDSRLTNNPHPGEVVVPVQPDAKKKPNWKKKRIGELVALSRIATITMAKCSVSKKFFNIRWEKEPPAGWKATWAFKVPDREMSRSGGSETSTQMNGELILEEYPGYPYCREHELIVCLKCNRLYCGDWHGKKTFECPWCGEIGSIVAKPADENVPTVRDA